MKTKGNKIQGINLLEMLIGIAIMSILTSFSLAMFFSWSSNKNSERVREQIVQYLHLAQSEAAAQHAYVALCGVNAKGQCSNFGSKEWVLFFDPYQEGRLFSQTALLHKLNLELKGKLYWRAYPLYHSYLIFNAEGTSDHINGLFWYCEKKDTYPRWAISLNQQGEIKVKTPHKNQALRDSRGKLLSCIA